jgi:hypothetical protein
MDRMFVLGCSFSNWVWPCWVDFMSGDYKVWNGALRGQGHQTMYSRLMEIIMDFDLTSEDVVVLQLTEFGRIDTIMPYTGWIGGDQIKDFTHENSGDMEYGWGPGCGSMVNHYNYKHNVQDKMQSFFDNGFLNPIHCTRYESQLILGMKMLLDRLPCRYRIITMYDEMGISPQVWSDKVIRKSLDDPYLECVINAIDKELPSIYSMNKLHPDKRVTYVNYDGARQEDGHPSPVAAREFAERMSTSLDVEINDVYNQDILDQWEPLIYDPEFSSETYDKWYHDQFKGLGPLVSLNRNFPFDFNPYRR